VVYNKPTYRRKREKHRINEIIRVKRVRLIDQTGKQIGIVDTRKALDMARSQGLDLVEVSPNTNPPVCRIMDYGKYKYQLAKKEKSQRKAQRQTSVKEVKFRLKTDEHDYNFKLKHILRFLEGRHKVKITIWFRGREMAHTEKGKEIIDRILNDLGDGIQIDQEAKLEGRNMSIIVSPKPGATFLEEEKEEES